MDGLFITEEHLAIVGNLGEQAILAVGVDIAAHVEGELQRHAALGRDGGSGADNGAAISH
ncbi:hypothetical protein D3C73_1648320 [compost metagenome]